MKRFVSLILSVCFLFSINTVSYAANISSRKASNPVIQSMNDSLSSFVSNTCFSYATTAWLPLSRIVNTSSFSP